MTGGSLTTRSPRWDLLDLRAALATGNPASGPWSTPFASDSIPAGRIGLAADGALADTLCFHMRRARVSHLTNHWLTFEMHAIMTHPKIGRTEVVEWFSEDGVPLLGGAP